MKEGNGHIKVRNREMKLKRFIEKERKRERVTKHERSKRWNENNITNRFEEKELARKKIDEK